MTYKKSHGPQLSQVHIGPRHLVRPHSAGPLLSLVHKRSLHAPKSLDQTDAEDAPELMSLDLMLQWEETNRHQTTNQENKLESTFTTPHELLDSDSGSKTNFSGLPLYK